jgi:hypothetical protein
MNIHTFPDFAALDAAFTSIPYNDLMVVESKKLVAVKAFASFAVTASGDVFHPFSVDSLIEKPQDLLDLVNAVKSAVREAEGRGYFIDPDFECFMSATHNQRPNSEA